MERVLLTPETRLAGPAAVALGNFDGVHLGHRALAEATIRAARAAAGASVVLTFEPHPAVILSPAHAPRVLTSLERKAELLAELGIDRLVVKPFSRTLAAMSAETFVESVLKSSLDARVVVVGPRFRFGHKRSGTAADLERAGLGVEVVPEVLVGGLPVSSTRVRDALTGGAVDIAQALLGQPFGSEGAVVAGDGRGRQIGIPTANLAATGELIPADGVYAGWGRLRSEGGGFAGAWPAVINIGRRPTFSGGERRVEAHLLEFSGDLYGRRLRLEYWHRLRDERRFSGVAELVRQIQADIARARVLLEKR
jgi:riboflavin kinase/FMN adenylyltransferase